MTQSGREFDLKRAFQKENITFIIAILYCDAGQP